MSSNVCKNLESVKGQSFGVVGFKEFWSYLNKDLDKAWRERVVKNHIELIILRLLKSKHRWACEINFKIRERFKDFIGGGAISQKLHSIEDKGYLQEVR